jgi:hypothetical protein
VTILGLLLGASLIYVLTGGFSADSRKKYPLVPLLLLLGCWTFRFVFKGRQAPASAFLVTGAAMCLGAAMTTWLVLGIWRYETARYNALAEFFAKRGGRDITVSWNPDLNRAWPQMRRSIGFGLDEAWVLDMAVEYRGAHTIGVVASDKSAVIEYDPETSKWVLGKGRDR